MNTRKYKISSKVFIILCTITIAVLSSVSVMAAISATPVDIKEGTYYIKAVNGNAKGQVLYWNENCDDQNISMMFEPCGGKHADYEIWYITKNRNFDNYYGIYLYKDYYGNKTRNKRIQIDNLDGKDDPYRLVGGRSGPHVFCGAFSNQDDAFEFLSDSKIPSYTNLRIRSKEDQYIFFRHKEVKVFKSDLIYVKANSKNDTSDKLWELIPVNYVKSLNNAAPLVTSSKNGDLNVNWMTFRNKVINSTAWKTAKYIEIQYSTDKNFQNNVKTKRILKGSVNKDRARSTLSKLKRKNTYYVRARLVDKNEVCSNWSKTVKVKAK